MKLVNLTTLILTIIGAVDCGLQGAADMDIIAFLFGTGTVLTIFLKICFGLSALYQLIPLMHTFDIEEELAEAHSGAAFQRWLMGMWYPSTF